MSARTNPVNSYDAAKAHGGPWLHTVGSHGSAEGLHGKLSELAAVCRDVGIDIREVFTS